MAVRCSMTRPHMADERHEAEILPSGRGLARVWHKVARARLPSFRELAKYPEMSTSKTSQLRTAGHWPTLVSAFLYFDYSFMVWTLLGVLANQIAAPESLNLTTQQRFFMVSVPILFGGMFRLVLGLLVDRIGAKT